jgi:hypothetical protein
MDKFTVRARAADAWGAGSGSAGGSSAAVSQSSGDLLARMKQAQAQTVKNVTSEWAQRDNSVDITTVLCSERHKGMNTDPKGWKLVNGQKTYTTFRNGKLVSAVGFEGFRLAAGDGKVGDKGKKRKGDGRDGRDGTDGTEAEGTSQASHTSHTSHTSRTSQTSQGPGGSHGSQGAGRVTGKAGTVGNVGMEKENRPRKTAKKASTSTSFTTSTASTTSASTTGMHMWNTGASSNAQTSVQQTQKSRLWPS